MHAYRVDVGASHEREASPVPLVTGIFKQHVVFRSAPETDEVDGPRLREDFGILDRRSIVDRVLVDQREPVGGELLLVPRAGGVIRDQTTPPCLRLDLGRHRAHVHDDAADRNHPRHRV